MSSIKFLKPVEAPQLVEIISPFAYGALESSIAKEAQIAAGRINKHLSNVAASFIDIGFELAEIKQKLPHGQFSAWVEAEFSMSHRSCQNFMNAASLAGAIGREVAEYLPQKLVYELGAKGVPTALVHKVYEQAENGESIDVAAVMVEIREAKASLKVSKPVKAKASKPIKIKVKSPAERAVSILRQALDKTALKMFREAFKTANADEFAKLLYQGGKS